MDLFSLPVVMIENILSYLTYDEIAKNRVVSKAFNDLCMRMLNRGFLLIERRHALALKSVKAQLPRRESERRYHQLSRHCDILTSIETRISMLNMTYSKFIDSKMCCFIPGKVLDEIRRVLTIVETSKTPPRAHEVLQELRDISSMAIEHFDDKISPAFRKKLQENVAQPMRRPCQVQAAMLAPLALRQEITRLRRHSSLTAKLSLNLASSYRKFYQRMTSYRKIVFCQSMILKQLSKKTKDQDSAIAELKKRIDECDIKYSELTHTNQAVGGKAIAATSTEVAGPSTQPLRHFSSQIKLDLSVLPIGTSKRNPNKLLPNIKPRKSVIKLPSLNETGDEPPPEPEEADETRSNPGPSTSTMSPKTRAVRSLARIRGITKDLRQLNNLAKEGKCKRSLAGAKSEVPEVKKQKLNCKEKSSN